MIISGINKRVFLYVLLVKRRFTNLFLSSILAHHFVVSSVTGLFTSTLKVYFPIAFDYWQNIPFSQLC